MSQPGRTHPPRPGPPAPHLSAVRRLRAKPWWPWLKRLGLLLFFLALAYLLVNEARRIDWSAVLASARRVPTRTLLGAAVLATANHALYSCFDLLGRRYTGHPLSAPRVMNVTFISYVFSLNFGSLVGAMALRYRLYTRQGLAYGTVTRVLGLSMITNWLGYALLGGVIFSLYRMPLPAQWQIDSQALVWLGLGMLAVGLTYLLLCAVSKQRSVCLKGHVLTLPGGGLALLQAGMGLLNWLLMSGLMFVLLAQKVDFTHVTSVMLVAAVASVIAHVPAGLGVLEAVFVALLSHRLPATEVLAALLVYRVIYHLIPLALATLAFAITEARTPAPSTD